MHYPGTFQHQTVLRAIVAHYANRMDVLAVSVFGSLGRGDWHPLSDIDLDVVITDGVHIDPADELGSLNESLAGIGESAVLVIPNGPDSVDAVLSSLMGLSIRYHPLETTSPNIVDSLLLLSGSLDAEVVRAAGRAQTNASNIPVSQLVDRCLRHLVETAHDLERRRLWSAVEGLHRARSLVMELFSQSQGGVRPLQTFQSEANPHLQSQLATTLPQPDMESVGAALAQFLNLLEEELPSLTGGTIELIDSQRLVLTRIREELSTDWGSLADRVANRFEEHGITRADVEDAVRWGREPR